MQVATTCLLTGGFIQITKVSCICHRFLDFATEGWEQLFLVFMAMWIVMCWLVTKQCTECALVWQCSFFSSPCWWSKWRAAMIQEQQCTMGKIQKRELRWALDCGLHGKLFVRCSYCGNVACSQACWSNVLIHLQKNFLVVKGVLLQKRTFKVSRVIRINFCERRWFTWLSVFRALAMTLDNLFIHFPRVEILFLSQEDKIQNSEYWYHSSTVMFLICRKILKPFLFSRD